MYKTNCMQSIERIAMWEVFSSIMSLIGEKHLRRDGAYKLNSCPKLDLGLMKNNCFDNTNAHVL